MLSWTRASLKPEFEKQIPYEKYVVVTCQLGLEEKFKGNIEILEKYNLPYCFVFVKDGNKHRREDMHFVVREAQLDDPECIVYTKK